MPDAWREGVAGVSDVARLKTNNSSKIKKYSPVRDERVWHMAVRERRAGKKTILIADDNTDTQAVLGILLRGAGFETVSAFDGVTAVTLAAQTRPDLVLMDIALPQMDGLIATQLIRRLSGLERVPIVGCSAYEPDEDVRSQHAYALMNAFLRKPTDFSTLLAVMQRLLIPTGQRPVTQMEPARESLVPLAPLVAGRQSFLPAT